MEFVLDNGSIRVALSTAGGSFTSIAANGREYLWQGDPAVWSGQAPICFPICGGLRDGRAMTMGGREVKLARHGFARKQEWKLEEQGDNMVALSLSSADHAELLEQYPYPFKIVARYTIDSEKVAVSYEVTNGGTVDMPFFVGGHPGFKCPLDEGESYDDYELRFEQREATELCTAVPSTGLIDVEHRSKNPMIGQNLPLTHELFDFAETIFDVLESRVVTFTKKTEDKVVTADKQSKKVPDPKQPENTTAYEIDNRQFLSNPDGQQGYGYYVHLSQPQKAYRMVIKIRSSGGQGYIRVNATNSPSQGEQVAQFKFDASGTTDIKFDKAVETQDIMLWVPLDSLPGNQLYIESIQVF